LDKTIIPNPSLVRWTWAEWSGKGKPKYKIVDAVIDDLEAALEKIIDEIG
jgi:hypothetical protein